jgi:hypothetical protein
VREPTLPLRVGAPLSGCFLRDRPDNPFLPLPRSPSSLPASCPFVPSAFPGASISMIVNAKATGGLLRCARRRSWWRKDGQGKCPTGGHFAST